MYTVQCTFHVTCVLPAPDPSFPCSPALPAPPLPQVVGNAAMTTTIFIIAPFVLLCAFAAPHVQPSNWLIVDWGAVQWGTFLNIMFWNLNYWDSVSCLAGEVDKPHKTFPR